jgi:hypothetical protein
VVDLAEPPFSTGWKAKVRKQMTEADAVIFLVTPAALRSEWLLTELGMAEGLDRIILPVTTGLKATELPEPLRGLQVTPFDEVDAAILALTEKLMAGTSGSE